MGGPSSDRSFRGRVCGPGNSSSCSGSLLLLSQLSLFDLASRLSSQKNAQLAPYFCQGALLLRVDFSLFFKKGKTLFFSPKFVQIIPDFFQLAARCPLLFVTKQVLLPLRWRKTKDTNIVI